VEEDAKEFDLVIEGIVVVVEFAPLSAWLSVGPL